MKQLVVAKKRDLAIGALEESVKCGFSTLKKACIGQVDYVYNMDRVICLIEQDPASMSDYLPHLKAAAKEMPDLSNARDENRDKQERIDRILDDLRELENTRWNSFDGAKAAIMNIVEGQGKFRAGPFGSKGKGKGIM